VRYFPTIRKNNEIEPKAVDLGENPPSTSSIRPSALANLIRKNQERRSQIEKCHETVPASQ
jgi:hypothetical protein